MQNFNFCLAFLVILLTQESDCGEILFYTYADLSEGLLD